MAKQTKNPREQKKLKKINEKIKQENRQSTHTEKKLNIY
jgi:hypothetical protein